MKKELNELKNTSLEYQKTSEIFKEKRQEFNNLVNKNFNGEKINDYTDSECEDVYDIASCFYAENSDVFELGEKLKNKNAEPYDYSNELLYLVVEKRDLNAIDHIGSIAEIIKIYLLFDRCGYLEVYEVEKEINDLLSKITENTDTILKQSKEAVVNTGKRVITTVGNIAKPYGEVAKGQLGEAKEKAKVSINKGAKSLIKKLEKIVEETK